MSNVQNLIDELLSLPPGHAIFDMDGTLIHGDVGEAALRRVLGALPPKARARLGNEDPWHRYEEICRHDFCDAGDIAGLALAGQTRESLKAMVEDAFAAGEIRFKDDVVGLAQAISSHHQVWILTGSAGILGELVGEKIGILNVVGLNLAMQDGILLEEVLPPCTCGQGKVEAARQFITPTPVFSIGDSPTDLPLLRTATIARTLGRIAGREFPAFS